MGLLFAYDESDSTSSPRILMQPFLESVLHLVTGVLNYVKRPPATRRELRDLFPPPSYVSMKERKALSQVPAALITFQLGDQYSLRAALERSVREVDAQIRVYASKDTKHLDQLLPTLEVAMTSVFVNLRNYIWAVSNKDYLGYYRIELSLCDFYSVLWMSFAPLFLFVDLLLPKDVYLNTYAPFFDILNEMWWNCMELDHLFYMSYKCH
jgi:hypothetical protein